MENEVIKNIKDDVADQANLVIEVIQNEINILHDEEVAHYEAGLKKEIETYLEKELNDLEVFAVTEASREKMETKRKLLALRSELVDSLFSNVKNKLIEYAKTEAYKEYLLNKLELLKLNGGVIYCKEDDVDFIKAHIKNADVKVEARYFAIGGFTYVDKSQTSEDDYSLDTSFNNQTEWFVNNSGFTI